LHVSLHLQHIFCGLPGVGFGRGCKVLGEKVRSGLTNLPVFVLEAAEQRRCVLGELCTFERLELPKCFLAFGGVVLSEATTCTFGRLERAVDSLHRFEVIEV
jgi:hypothetical protein